MPVLLLREDSSVSLSTLVDKSQKKNPPLLEYDLQLNNNHLHLILITKPDRSTSTDEGFESDVDSLSIVSSDNDSFTNEKPTDNGSKTTESDSANGSSSSDSDTEVSEKKKADANVDVQRRESERTPNSVEKYESYTAAIPLEKTKESFNLVECVCYTDVKCTDILIFVIRNEAFVFKFNNLIELQQFYTNFTALKAVANQKVYNRNARTKFNLLQRTDQNGITHIEITREVGTKPIKNEGPSSIISINTPGEVFENYPRKEGDRTKDVNSRQRVESKFVNGIKYNTINSKLGPKAKIITKSNSIENILDLDQQKSNLVSKSKDANLRKVWNSAEDILEPPKRPERRKKVKGRAPQPPEKLPDKQQDVFSGQYVRVNVNFDPVKDLDKTRMIIKSSLHEPHPRKLQNFNILSTKSNFATFLKPKVKQVLKYEPKITDSNPINRNKAGSDWTNSVPRLLKKPRSKSETRTFTPMAYRYIDTTQDYPSSYHMKSKDKANFTAGTHFSHSLPNYGQNLTFSNYLRGDNNQNSISNRLFGLSPKLREFSDPEESKRDSKRGSGNEINVCVSRDNNLKSVIKNKDEAAKKKNEKKVTFSAYTTVQVV